MHVKTVPASYEVKEAGEDRTTVEGYASIFSNVDLGGDRVRKGAFRDSIKERLPSNLIKLFAEHTTPIGNVTEAEEDEKGLWVKGEVFHTSAGLDALKLIRGRVLDRMSIGYDLEDGGYEKNAYGGFDLSNVKLFECSFVPVAMNEEAMAGSLKTLRTEQAEAIANLRADLDNLKQFVPGERYERSNMLHKAASGDTDLPIASDTSWDGDAAEQAVAKWATNEDGELDMQKFSRAFFWKAEGAESQQDCKLGFATVANGELKAVPAGVKAAAAAVQGARATPNIPESDVEGVKAKIATYYNRMDLGSPPWVDDGSSEGSSDDGKASAERAEEETETEEEAGTELERIAKAIEQMGKDLTELAQTLREQEGSSGESEPVDSEEKAMEYMQRELAAMKSL